jgi:hypothetical protein
VDGKSEARPPASGDETDMLRFYGKQGWELAAVTFDAGALPRFFFKKRQPGSAVYSQPSEKVRLLQEILAELRRSSGWAAIQGPPDHQ